jgi:hypothetical protein
MSYTIDLRIDELVLDGIEGIESVDRHELGAALEQELARLVRDRGVPPAWMDGRGAARIEAGSFSATPGAGARQLAGQIAHAVYAGGSS